MRNDVMEFFTGPRLLKTSPTNKALTIFTSLEQAYDARILAFRKDQQTDLYSRVILPCVYRHVPKVYSINWLGNTARAFEDIIMHDGRSYGIWPTNQLKVTEGLYHECRVREFIKAS